MWQYVAELLDNGTDINDGTVGSDQSTALIEAVSQGQLDIVRLPLDRGASQDQSDLDGLGPSMLCWVRYPDYRTSGVDMFNVLCEYALQDKALMTHGVGYLHMAALYRGATEIYYLIRFGLDTTGKNWAGFSPLHYAVGAGNLATYFALLSNHDLANSIGNHGYPLLHIAIMGRCDLGQILKGQAGLMYQETIIRDLLHRGVDPATTNASDRIWYFPKSVIGLSITAQQLAAAYDPETEAWYMPILRDCGFLEAAEDIARLRYLESQGYVSGGHVIGEEESVHEGVSDKGSVYEDRESQNGGSELEEEDCFWDAEEGV